MQGQIKECWRELCERAVSEQDPKKFLVVVREINVLLEVKTDRLKQSSRIFCWVRLSNERSFAENGMQM